MAIFGRATRATLLCPDLFLDGFPLDGVVLDVSMVERHQIDRDVTLYPVEFGGSLSDHVHQRPRRLEVQAWLTDTPSDPFEAAAEALRNLTRDARLTVGEPVNGPLASTRAKDLFAVLELLATRAAACTVVTDLYVYEEMVLTALGVPRTPEDGRGLTVEMTFQRILTARTSTRAALVVEEPTAAAPPPQPTTNVGKAAVGPVDVRTGGAQAFDQVRSWLGGLF